LAALWTVANSAERRAITTAAHVIEQRLRGDPDNQGESRPHGRRILFESPLGVRFRVYSQQGVVRILQVWQI
jgi:hypothetical protein